MPVRCLHDYLIHTARARGDDIALVESQGACMTYRDLDRLSNRVRDRLHALGIGCGDRVGIYVPKSIESVASIYGILKAGAAYVPVDPTAPVVRNAFIFHDCSVRAVFVDASKGAMLAAELAALGKVPPLLELTGIGGGHALAACLDLLDRDNPAPQSTHSIPDPDELAYVLYTSGSTGKPKGVMLSHRNAVSFVQWCYDTFEPRPEDCFSSHAPFHFDLSILDLYLPATVGARLVLIGEDIGKDAVRLAELIASMKISCWYSAPSILSLLAQFGQLHDKHFSSLRIVHFAGEVFPVKHLRLLKSFWPAPRYFNLYGPTETNVCTYHEIPTVIPEDRTDPYPIGKACAHYRIRVVDEELKDVSSPTEGELIAAGAGMMRGYWNLAEQSEKAFLVDADGERWYRTGDLVVMDVNGDYRYKGRRDRMVKKRGYRVELGEIEATLYRHPDIKEVAVIATQDDGVGMQVTAFLSTKSGGKLSLIALKKFCADQVPLYMVPDSFSFLDSLPKTSTDKVDYQRLKELR